MAWIESHIDIGDHPKITELCFELMIKKHEAVGHLHLLWHFTMKYAWRDGDLRRFTPRVICQAVGWDKDPDAFINALRRTGWLEPDTYQIHDWLEYSGKLVTDRLYNEKRRKTASKPVNPRKLGATLPYPTLPNLTKDSIVKPEASQADKPLTEIQKIVTAFKMLQGFDKNDKSWDKLNFARCSRSAKALQEFLGSWGAAVDCLEDVYTRLTKKGLTVTFETVLKHAADWKRDQNEKGGQKNGVFSVPGDGSRQNEPTAA